jgi:hypothetical protein
VRFGDEQGGIISGWLVQLIVIMAIVAAIGYEGISIAIAHLTLDEDAREVAAAARSAYGGSRDAEDAIDAGLDTAEEQGIEVLGVIEIEEPPELVFDLQKQAGTMVIHRIGFLEDMTIARTSRSVPLTP